VVHCYGHAGAGYQSSWSVYDTAQSFGVTDANHNDRGTAERVLELVQKINTSGHSKL
jgi:hypothetical protein